MPVERSPERDGAIKAALPHVPALGWTRAALRAGLRRIGEDPESEAWLFPTGPIGAVEAWLDLADREMEAAAGGLSALRTPGRIRHLILLRFAQAAPHKDALRRALAQLALPWNLPAGARSAARTASAIWHAAGDRSADFSWYTRRATLAAVHGATLAFWLQDDDPEMAATAAFLDRRLAGLARLSRPRRPPG